MNPEIRDHAYQFFIEEVPELLEMIENGLLTLRTARNPAQVHEIMRAAHSLKGGAASVELPVIRDIAHRLEDIFKAFYSEEVVIDEELESLLLQGYDCLKEPLLQQIHSGSFDAEEAQRQAQPVFEALEFLLKDYLAAGEQFIPSSADLGIDIVSSLFEVDIVQGLEQIATALDSGDETVVKEVLSTQTEIFAGLAEVLNLTGFKEITELVQTSLAVPSESVLPLATFALADWRESCHQVLQNGDRHQGGTPSQALRNLAQPLQSQGSESLLLAAPFSMAEPLPEWGNVFGAENPDILPPAEEFAGMEFPDLLPLPEMPPTTEEFVPETVNTQEPAYQFFIEEVPELLQTIESGLLNLRGDRSASRVHEIMRAAHSLKGGAASVGLNTIKEISHRLEDIFKALYSETLVLDENLESLLLAAFDCLREPLENQMRTGHYDPQLAQRAAQPLIEAIKLQLGDHLAAGEQFLPSSADLGVDIVASIFEVDIGQGLAQIESALATQEPLEIQNALTSQAEVFLGLAELLNLPGFKSITEKVQRAILNHPDQMVLIGQIALQNWQESCRQVLHHGDRQQGGSPSSALVELGTVSHQPAPETAPPLQEESSPQLSLGDLFFGEDEEVVDLPSPEPEPEVEINLNLEILSDSQANAALEDIFGLVAPEPLETLPALSLEEVFGGLIPDSQIPLPEPEPLPSLTEEAITELVQSVEQTFEQLPALEEAAPLPTPTLPAVTREPTKETPTAANPAALSIRVDFQRLERMNNWVGELAINRNSLSLQNQQLQSAVRSLLSRFSRFQSMTGKLRELADQLVIMPGGQNILSKPENSWVANAFDVLEMDSYGALSGQLQDILEEMMQLEEAVDDIVLFARATNQSLESQRQMLFSLRDELMWARMLPLGEVLNRFPRVLRDMSTKYRKPVQLRVYGTHVLVDRLAIEKLYDPLLHLLRNAFDHGIEAPATRIAAGKPESGTIEIHAYHQGNQTIIELRDDGGGLNNDKIARKAIEQGLITAEQAQILSPDQIANLIFEPNFSTASQVSELSGRGVGLDVVRQQIQSLKGNIVVSSRPGRGTTFSLRLPLTLTIAKLLVCLIRQDDQRTNTAVALPSDSIAELMVPLPNQVRSSGGQRFLLWQQQMIPIYPLSQLLPYNCPLAERQSSKVLATVPHPEDWSLPLILLRQGDHYYALEVSRLITEQELVIKPFASVVQAPNYLYGCTILGDGSLIPVINGSLLLEWHWERGEDSLARLSESAAGAPSLEELSGQLPLILVVDDSAALRRTLAFTLEKSGYRVVQAKDGQEALETLSRTPGIQLVICDVEMPNLNGFEFLGQRRRNPEMSKIPVAMLTSRGSDKHRQLATHLGASAYFTKPYIEQQFLLAIKDLLAQPLPV